MSVKEMSVFPVGEKNDAFAQYFVGQSYLNMLSTQQVSIGNVTFEPGCRNNWHIHHAEKGGGQMLLVTAKGAVSYLHSIGLPSPSASLTPLPRVDALAGRSGLSGTLEAQYGAKWWALLQRAGAE